MANLNELNPFARFCCTIGHLPTSYMESLSYEEQLIWFCEFLKNKVIPAVNQNGNAIEELQKYLENLDLTEEVNQKLDQMVEDGTLAEIINQEIFTELNNSINQINENLNNNSTIMIGDSYGVGITSGGTITGWCDRLKDLLNLSNTEYFKFVEGGSGFVSKGTSNHNFIELLQANINIIEDPTKIKNIIVCGGYNDYNANADDLNNYVQSFVEYCKQNFENATVYVGMIGNSGANTVDGSNKRKAINKKVLRCYQNSTLYGAVYLNGVENIMKFYNFFMSDDNIHPNNNGYTWLASSIFNAFKTGYASFCSGNLEPDTNYTSEIFTKDNNIYSQLNNDIVSIIANQITFETINKENSFSDSVNLGRVDLYCYRSVDNLVIPVAYYMADTDGNFYGGFGKLNFNTDGTISLQLSELAQDGTGYPTYENIDYIKINSFSYFVNSKNC